MTPAPSSPVPTVERIELPGGYHLRVERFELAHPWVIMSGPNDEPMLSGEVVDPYGLAAALATPTPGRAAEPDTMGEVERLVRTFSASINVFWTDSQAGSRADCLAAEQALLSAVRTIVTEWDDARTRAETAEAQLATLRAEVVGVSGAWQNISTAPKDGTTIWLAWSDGPKLVRVNKAKWREGKSFPWRILDGYPNDGLNDEPDLLWMPFYELPKRPEPPLFTSGADR
jgi:hypothetical protein